ncbi:VCBS repeat-containing protein [Streptomyces sp. NPDC001941]|uniref:FG-GAP repeat domain-containing protein n=1 Tax=Streptomyces sp. NPDC001941 TaxID=3154659 RepID=UPI003321CAB1
MPSRSTAPGRTHRALRTSVIAVAVSAAAATGTVPAVAAEGPAPEPTLSVPAAPGATPGDGAGTAGPAGTDAPAGTEGSADAGKQVGEEDFTIDSYQSTGRDFRIYLSISDPGRKTPPLWVGTTDDGWQQVRASTHSGGRSSYMVGRADLDVRGGTVKVSLSADGADPAEVALMDVPKAVITGPDARTGSAFTVTGRFGGDKWPPHNTALEVSVAGQQKTVTVPGTSEWSVDFEDVPEGRHQITVRVLAGPLPPSEETREVTVEQADEDVPVDAGDVAEPVLADFTGTGKADLVARNDEDGKLYRFPGKGDGTFATGEVVFEEWGYEQTSAGDFDGDGIADLVATDGGSAWIWRGNGDGTFQERTELTKWPAKYAQTTAGDFDGDGVADIVALDTTSDTAYLWRGTKDSGPGKPVFSAPRKLTAWKGYTQTTGGDADGDGITDVMAVTPSQELRVWISDGNVNGNPFKAPVRVMSFAGFSNLTTGDFSGNKVADVLAIDTNTNEVKTFTSSGKPGSGMLGAPRTVELTVPAP